MGGLTPEEIESHAAAIRALARRLVGDAHLAEDVAQESLAVALRADAPRGERFTRWLRGVGRNVSRRTVRTETRRKAREEHAPVPRDTAAPDEIVARTEMRHRVVTELLALDEPYRRTLLMRYFEGLEPSEIAVLEDEPAGTVRSRCKRGLDMLRARLDDAHDGRRAAWLLPLAAALRAPGAPPSPSSPARFQQGGAAAAGLTVGVAVMSWKLTAAVLGIAVLGGAAWLVSDGSPEPSPDAPAARAANADAEDDAARRRVVPDVHEAADAAGAQDAPIAPESLDAARWVTGRVLGRGRHPEAGATVALVTRIAESVTSTTDTDGRFRLPSVAAPESADLSLRMGVVHAWSFDGRAAVRSVLLRADEDHEVQVELLVLGRARDVVVRTESGGAPVAGAIVTLAMPYRVAEGSTGDDGTHLFARVPDADFSVLQAFHPELGRAQMRLENGPVEGPVVLELTRRDVTIRTVRAGSGEPVPDVPLSFGASIDTPGMSYGFHLDPPLGADATGADGVAVVSIGASDRLSITAGDVGGSGAMARHVRPTVRVRAEETEAVIQMPAIRTFRWRLVPGEVSPPAEGEVVDLFDFTNSGQRAPAETAVVENAHLVVKDVAVDGVSCYARTRDGKIARIYARIEDEEVRDVEFRRERHIDVVLRDADGSPVAGRSVVAKDQGNNPIRPPIRTDENGVARIEPLHGRLADVYLLSPGGDVWSGTRIGSVDVEDGDARIEHTIAARVRATLAITCDGRRSLPDDFTIYGGPVVVSEDPAAGTLVVEYEASPAPVAIWFNARGFPRANPSLPGAGASEPVEIALTTGAEVRGVVVAPPDGRAGGSVERWDEEHARWTTVRLRGSPSAGRSLTGAVFGDELLPGRYRLRDVSTGLATVPADVAAGETADLGELDLSQSGYVTGTIEVPEGASPSGARVIVEGGGLDRVGFGFDSQSGAVREAGTFRVRVPGDRAVRLRVEHPTLRSGAESTTEVREPREGVVLRVESGPVLVVRLAGDRPAASMRGSPKVLFFAGSVSGEPAFERSPVEVEGTYRVGLPPPGRYTLWLDVAPWTPLVVPDVQVGDADVDLGERTMSLGSSVRVRILVGEGESAPRIAVFANCLGTPTYSRGLNSNGGDDVVLAGLGAGRHNVQVMSIMGTPGGDRIVREIEVDGAETTVQELTLDLR